MSTSLVWEPARRKTKALSTGLKWALQKKYGSPVNMTMDSSHIEYLEGLRDGGIEDAAELIDAIEKHDYVDVREE